MSSLIPDGVYKIRNSQSSDYVADLLNGNALSPICARKDGPANRHDKWRIKNIGYRAGSNLITIENVHTSGSYAYADQSQARALWDWMTRMSDVWN
ncbi:hypothetical protein HD554DRAFT_2176968 [Boletus coccyginus]|nr:hypothetical protein HD554DRAFT_2176968 [Boletus coccyginus]